MPEFALILLCWLVPAAPTWVCMDKAVAAYNRDDHETAAREFRLLAERGDASARLNLGLMYYNGLGVRRDYTEAVKWFRRAAEQGEAGGQHALGLMYRKGQGVRQDYAKALKWFRRAAEQGVSRAQNNLGFIYGTGMGVPKDFVQAHKWYYLAAANGNLIASINRNIVAAKMTTDDVSTAQRMAREWLAKHGKAD